MTSETPELTEPQPEAQPEPQPAPDPRPEPAPEPPSQPELAPDPTSPDHEPIAPLPAFASRRPVIGVMGPALTDVDTLTLAREVGRLVAERGAILLTGGRGGVMEAAAHGARDADGLTVGILPGRDDRESRPNPYIDIAIFTGIAEARNYVNVCSSDVVIAIAQGWGTLSEIALARKIGKPVVLLRSWDLGHGMIVATTAEDAVRRAFAAISR